MKKRHLEISLSKLKDIEDPDPRWEQYRTPSRIASDILWRAMENGDIEGRSVIELGCGGAPFALGALLMGAKDVVGVDIDPRSLEVARQNLNSLIKEGSIDEKADCEFIESDVSSVSMEVEGSRTVFMNPPFGAQKKHADRPFIEASCRLGHSIYSIHNGGTDEFLSKRYGEYGFKIVNSYGEQIKVPHRFHFHRKEVGMINVIILNAVKY